MVGVMAGGGVALGPDGAVEAIVGVGGGGDWVGVGSGGAAVDWATVGRGAAAVGVGLGAAVGARVGVAVGLAVGRAPMPDGVPSGGAEVGGTICETTPWNDGCCRYAGGGGVEALATETTTRSNAPEPAADAARSRHCVTLHGRKRVRITGSSAPFRTGRSRQR